MTVPAPRRPRRPAPHPRFPLADWIDAHPTAPHHLGHSGMVGELRATARWTAEPPPATEEELRGRLAAALGVAADRVFPTHGATEGYALVLLALRRSLRATGGPIRLRRLLPEYPPLLRAAELVGFRPVGPGVPAAVAVFSEPNNPTGRRRGAAALLAAAGKVRAVVVDETFREFSPAPSIAAPAREGIWTLGSMTKSYGADFLRVGYVVAPPEAVAGFAEIKGVLADNLPAASAAGAVALLRHRAEVLREARAIFAANRRALARALPPEELPGGPPSAAPTWFDRGPRGRGLDGDRLARAALRTGVLVSPGSLFGDPAGVRVCLTRRSFPDDLRAYLEVRRRFLRSQS